MISRLISLLLVSVLSSCTNDQLSGAWFVIDASDHSTDHYRQIYDFKDDSVKIYNIGVGSNSFKISLDSSIIEYNGANDEYNSINDIGYEFHSDTLLLYYPHYILKLLSYVPKKLSPHLMEIESSLLKNHWTYSTGDLIFEVSFTNQKIFETLRKSEADVFLDQRYLQSLERPLWTVEVHDGQAILINQGFANFYYINTFFLNKITDIEILATAWNGGQEYPITFTAQKPISNDDLRRKNELLTKSWQLVSSKEFEYPQPEDSDSLVELGPLYGPQVNHNTIIHKSDLTEHNLQYTFNADSTFSLTVDENYICCGEWYLSANGKIVRLNTSLKYLQEYEANCRGFVIYELNSEELKIGQDLPIYQNDSLVEQSYFYLDFK